MLFVFVWLPKLGAGNIGHGSMQVNGEYVSNWPGSLISVLYGPGQAAPDFNFDKAAEGALPEVAFKLKGLDESAIQDKWAEVKKGLTYSFATKNCFQTVAEVPGVTQEPYDRQERLLPLTPRITRVGRLQLQSRSAS